MIPNQFLLEMNFLPQNITFLNFIFELENKSHHYYYDHGSRYYLNNTLYNNQKCLENGNYYIFFTLGSFFSLELDMYPPHPHEYSVDMIEFLLNNTDLMDFLNWQVDSSRVLYSSPMFSVPSPD